MTTARSQLVDLDVTLYYHCISRCVRRAFLCGDGFEHRRQWIEDRIEMLAGHFAVSVCGFSVMGNHLHLLVRLDPNTADAWSSEEVARRWLAVYPPRTADLDDSKIVKTMIDEILKDERLVAKYRRRLQDLGWFMKALKEPLARIANKEDDCKGTFWESRYKSIAVLDEEALLATCAYIDLNPVAAGIAATPETSPHTSVRQRVQHVRSKGKLGQLKAAAAGSVAGSRAAGRIEQDHWLCPFEDRRMLNNTGGASKPAKPIENGAAREGMLDGFSLGSYLLLVDYTSRLCRNGKARVSRQVAGILDRLGTSAAMWDHHLKKLFARSRLLGNYFTTSPARLQELAEQRGVHHLNNLIPPPGG